MTPSIRVAAIAAFCLITFVILGFNDLGGYTDAGIHYEFSEEIARFWRWPLPAATSLAPMSHYPPAAHVVSLLIGWLAGSVIYGIFIVTAISFLVIYSVLAELMRRESAPNTLLACLVFLLVALVCRSGRFLEGNEIVDNFFFAQFAGTAGLLASFLFLCRLRKRPFVLWLGAAALVTHLVGWIYTISTIELALSCVMFRFLDLLSTGSKQSAVKVMLSSIVLGAAAVIHPTIIGSLGIAANDGAISISTNTAIISFLTLLIGTLALTVSPRRSKLINYDTIVALSLGVLAACSLQTIALGAFNMGSAYAIKKYFFLVGTLSVLVFACLVVDRAPTRYEEFARHLPAAFLTIIMPVFGIASLLITTAFKPKTPVQEFVRYDREVRDFLSRNSGLDLEGNTVSWSLKVSPHVNYTIGLGLLRPLGAAIDQHTLLLPNPQLSGAARYILVDADRSLLYDESCVVAVGHTLAAVSANCGLPPAPANQK